MTNLNNQQQISRVEKKLRISFKDKALLLLALTHRSFLNENRSEKINSNERLEFLGDAVLEFIISDLLYQKYSHQEEGWLTNLRSNVVRTTTLSQLAKKLGFGQFILMSRGEKKAGGGENISILADSTEAIIGAIYLDQGLKAAEKFVARNFVPLIEDWVKRGQLKDAKSLLQEKIQVNNNPPPVYKTIKEIGPDHQKVFTVGVFLGDQLLDKASGRSKREAEEKVAQKVLEKEVKK